MYSITTSFTKNTQTANCPNGHSVYWLDEANHLWAFLCREYNIDTRSIRHEKVSAEFAHWAWTDTTVLVLNLFDAHKWVVLAWNLDSDMPILDEIYCDDFKVFHTFVTSSYSDAMLAASALRCSLHGGKEIGAGYAPSGQEQCWMHLNGKHNSYDGDYVYYGITRDELAEMN